jgi:hypothetical protein
VIPLPVFLVNDKNCTDLNFSHFFCELGLKMLGPQQWQLVNLANKKSLSFSDRYKNKVNIVPLKILD